MKRIISITFLCMIGLAGWSQTRAYSIYQPIGNTSELLNMGFVAAEFNFDSVGSRWNMKTENDYLRFKILHFYILNERKEGEHWKKQYRLTKKMLDDKFDKYMESRLKKCDLKISTTYENARYKLFVYFVDKSENVQVEDYCAIFNFVDTKTRKIIVQYYIEEKKQSNPSGGFYNSDPIAAMCDISITMSNFLKKQLK